MHLKADESPVVGLGLSPDARELPGVVQSDELRQHGRIRGIDPRARRGQATIGRIRAHDNPAGARARRAIGMRRGQRKPDVLGGRIRGARCQRNRIAIIRGV